MIDTLSLLISHGLMMVAAFRLLGRADLDADPVPGERSAGPRTRWGGRPRA